MAMRFLLLLALGVFATMAPLAAALPLLPPSLGVSANEQRVLVAHAKGVQTYECRAKAGDPKQFEWFFTGPEAELFDEAGHQIGRHYGGPTWELADGSKVVGAVRAAEPAPFAGTVPWLLLAAKSHAGQGQLSAVTSIQRLETRGGKAPAEVDAASAGQKLRVPYTATYYFYAPK